MRLPFLEWAFNSRNNTVDNVIELITILDSIEKKPEEQTRNGRNARWSSGNRNKLTNWSDFPISVVKLARS